MKFTVAIVSYNAAEHIEQCLDSVVNQTYKDLDIIVVDDNSNDTTADVVKGYQKRDSRIRLIVQPENRSALQARKTAVLNAKSEYVWFIDSDDRIDDLGAIGVLSRELKKANYPDMLCFGSNDYYENGEFKRKFVDWGKDKSLAEWKLDSDFRPYTRITKRKVLERAVQVIPDDLYLYRHNDLFMFCLVKLCTFSKESINKALYRYTLSSASVTNQKDKASVTKHAELIKVLLTKYAEVARKIEQNDVCIETFVESEKGKLFKYAKGQYSVNPELYLHALKKFYDNDRKVVISLTTYSKRIQTVHKTIESLLNQSIAVDKIILWLDETEISPKDLPTQLERLSSERFEVKFCPNHKSYKKLIPTLKAYPEATIITFDDDMNYPENQVEKLLLSHYENPNEVIANVARNISVEDGQLQPYTKWVHAFEEQVGKPLKSLIPIGVGGVLYPKDSLNDEVLNVAAFMKLAPHGDDLWFKCMTLLNDRKVIVTEAGFKLGKHQLEGTAEIGLWQSVNEGTDSNFEQLSAIIKSYLKVSARLFEHSFYNFEIRQDSLLRLYTELDRLKKSAPKSLHSKIKSIASKFDLVESQNNTNSTNVDISIGDIELPKNPTPFAHANNLARNGEYEEAAIIYNELSKQTPSFKYYKINYELMLSKIQRRSEGSDINMQG